VREEERRAHIWWVGGVRIDVVGEGGKNSVRAGDVVIAAVGDSRKLRGLQGAPPICPIEGDA
jgi:hypothetical protein